jgi:hypothetical protein
MSQPTATNRCSAANDFDFLVGTWTSQQRRLRLRLQGCQEWESFAATVTCRHLPGGNAVIESFVAETWRPGFVGTALRVYNPATDLWSIFWFTNDGGGIDKATGHLEPPVVGRFEGNMGVFECDDHFEGQPIRVQYQWTRVDANHARWQQAFLPNGGTTWEVNWTAEFKRQGA